MVEKQNTIYFGWFYLQEDNVGIRYIQFDEEQEKHLEFYYENVTYKLPQLQKDELFFDGEDLQIDLVEWCLKNKDKTKFIQIKRIRHKEKKEIVYWQFYDYETQQWIKYEQPLGKNIEQFYQKFKQRSIFGCFSSKQVNKYSYQRNGVEYQVDFSSFSLTFTDKLGVKLISFLKRVVEENILQLRNLLKSNQEFFVTWSYIYKDKKEEYFQKEINNQIEEKFQKYIDSGFMYYKQFKYKIEQCIDFWVNFEPMNMIVYNSKTKIKEIYKIKRKRYIRKVENCQESKLASNNSNGNVIPPSSQTNKNNQNTQNNQQQLNSNNNYQTTPNKNKQINQNNSHSSKFNSQSQKQSNQIQELNLEEAPRTHNINNFVNPPKAVIN